MENMNAVDFESMIADRNVLEISAERYSDLMDNFKELQDAAMLTVSTPNGWICYEHILLDRKLHLFVARSFEDGTYAGAVGILSARVDLENCEQAYFITSNNDAAKRFYLSLIEQEDMFS